MSSPLRAFLIRPPSAANSPPHRRRRCRKRDECAEFAADSLLEGNGFELPVPREISGGFEASAELRPIDPRRGGIIRVVVSLGKPIEVLRRLEEPPFSVE
jgi:hypothetical protein